MNELQDINWLIFTLVGLVLFILGIGAAFLAYRMNKAGTMKGRLAVMTMLCVFITLVGSIFVIGFTPAVLVGLLFFAIGLPVLIGEAIVDALDEKKARALQVAGLEDAES